MNGKTALNMYVLEMMPWEILEECSDNSNLSKQS